MAKSRESRTAAVSGENRSLVSEHTTGVLPLVHLKHLIFGNCLVSLPFVDGGGILADCIEAKVALLSEAIKLARKIGANRLELRSERPDASGIETSSIASEELDLPIRVATKSNKVRMLLTLPESSELLRESFKSKLRSQINKPLKEGCTCSIGGLELLEDFYKVFLANMRDLGSPVHSVNLMRHVLCEFSESARIFVVYKSKEPVASAMVIGLDKELRNPWASSLRKCASLSANMLLYLRMLEYACDNGYRVFDFGRSTRGEGTYRFKEQWGAVAAPLYWQYISLDGTLPNPEGEGKERFDTATLYWRKLPLIVTRVIGPSIRKHISL
jgi:serine/alanine adding enzyme